MASFTAVQAVVQNSDGTWDNRPTSATTTLVIWIRIVAGSADPAAVAPSSVAGAYNDDPVVGVF